MMNLSAVNENLCLQHYLSSFFFKQELTVVRSFALDFFLNFSKNSLLTSLRTNLLTLLRADLVY